MTEIGHGGYPIKERILGSEEAKKKIQGLTQYPIRSQLANEVIEEVLVVGRKCYVKIGKPVLHPNPYGRLEFTTLMSSLDFDVMITSEDGVVMEG